MIGLEDRQALARDIHAAHAAGAQLRLACETAPASSCAPCSAGRPTKGSRRAMAGRWPCAPCPSHALSHDERAQLLLVANEARFAAVPSARIVPMLADEGVYLASESHFGRVLRAQGQTAHHAHRHVRWGAGTYVLAREGLGRWFQRYLILDLYSRKIVGWEGTTRMTPTTPRTWCVARRLLRASQHSLPSRCCMAITAPR